MDAPRDDGRRSAAAAMKFTVIGHACLFIETGSERILVDPWLSGSCYWRSWWHFPPNMAIRQEVLEPEYVYLSHHHFDHFHYPSLRRISKRALVVQRGGVVLADLNDCKIKGGAVGPMVKAFGRPTVLFKSHSFAQAYPNCYDIADPADAQLMTREDFLETFIDAVRELKPTYAIPFASMVAFLHPES